MDTSKAFSASQQIRQFWVVRKALLGPAEISQGQRRNYSPDQATVASRPEAAIKREDSR